MIYPVRITKFLAHSGKRFVKDGGNIVEAACAYTEKMFNFECINFIKVPS